MNNQIHEILERISALETSVSGDELDRHVSTREVAERYNVVPRTIERWLTRPELKFPQPVVINKRRYWSLRALRKYDVTANQQI